MNRHSTHCVAYHTLSRIFTHRHTLSHSCGVQAAEEDEVKKASAISDALLDLCSGIRMSNRGYTEGRRQKAALGFLTEPRSEASNAAAANPDVADLLYMTPDQLSLIAVPRACLATQTGRWDRALDMLRDGRVDDARVYLREVRRRTCLSYLPEHCGLPTTLALCRVFDSCLLVCLRMLLSLCMLQLAATRERS